ncbi:MAG: cytochrome b5-like heme/steroid binding domain-containing protein [bacterium]
MKQKIIPAVIFLVVAGVVILIITQIAKKNAPNPTNPDTTATATTTIPATSFTFAEVAKHATAADCWTTVNGNVYNLTPFVSKHPGGVGAISQICGVDGTAAFTDQHGGQRKPEKELAGLEIGTLKK